MQGLMQDWPLNVNRILDFAAKFHGEQQVISKPVKGDEVTSTYSDIHRRARLCSLALRRLGVKEGTIVATLAWNTAEHLEAWYGIMGLGAVCHTLNPRLFEDDLAYIINHADDMLIMAEAMFVPLLERLQEKCPRVQGYILLCGDALMPPTTSLPNCQSYESLLKAEEGKVEDFQWAVVDENAACGLCYTSGTTGKPKGVLYSHRSNFLHCFPIIQPDLACLSSTSVLLLIVPMFHANAWGLAFAAPMVGAKLILPGPHLSGPVVYDTLESHHVTTTAAVPTVLLGLLEHINTNKLKLSTLKLMVVGGTACPKHMMEQYEEKYGVQVHHAWGMTETSPAGTGGAVKGTLGHLTPAQQRNIKIKQGRPHVFCDLRVADDAGEELPWDGKTVGNIQVRGPIVVAQYYKEDKPATSADGWFDTGDVGTVDKFGHLQITDRSKDLVKSGGEWISSVEIENLAVAHPKVRQAAVIAVPHPKWSERPLLLVTPKEASEPPTKEEMLDFLVDKIAKWWLPDDVLVLEEIPIGPTGKVSKKTLREMHQNGTLGGAKKDG